MDRDSDQNRSGSLTGASDNFKRRGLLAGTAALVAGVLAKVTAQPVAAADGQPVILGQTNTETSPTRITRTGPDFNEVLRVTNNLGNGVVAETASSNAAGIYGQDTAPSGGVGVQGVALATTDGIGVSGSVSAVNGGIGVSGIANAANGAGVRGDSAAGTALRGVSSSGRGVWGSSDTSTGVFGQSSSEIGLRGGSSSGTGVFGETFSSSGNQAAVQGVSQAGDAAGVRGRASSANASGVVGETAASPGGTGVTGTVLFAGNTSGVGVLGSAPDGTAIYGVTNTGLAGQFDGPVLVNGDFTVTGAKSAAVPFPDGSLRRLYCVESPESFFEDFGSGVLTSGQAIVPLQADFAAVIDSASYLVYLTPEGDSNGLYVSSKSASGFTVREQRGGTSTLSFSYRVVARRKDIVAPRLQELTREGGTRRDPRRQNRS